MASDMSREILKRVGKEFEDFISCMNEVKHGVYVVFHAKRWHYGAKVVVVVRNRSSYSTIIYSLMKIWCLNEILMFRVLLDGIKNAVYKYLGTSSESTSDSFHQ